MATSHDVTFLLIWLTWLYSPTMRPRNPSNHPSVYLQNSVARQTGTVPFTVPPAMPGPVPLICNPFRSIEHPLRETREKGLMRYAVLLALVLFGGCHSATKTSSTAGVMNQGTANGQAIGTPSTMADELNNPNSPLAKRSIYFDFDSYEVKPEYQSILQAHADYLRLHPSRHVLIQGNTDERGTSEYNLALGAGRRPCFAHWKRSAYLIHRSKQSASARRSRLHWATTKHRGRRIVVRISFIDNARSWRCRPPPRIDRQKRFVTAYCDHKPMKYVRTSISADQDCTSGSSSNSTGFPR